MAYTLHTKPMRTWFGQSKSLVKASQSTLTPADHHYVVKNLTSYLAHHEIIEVMAKENIK